MFMKLRTLILIPLCVLCGQVFASDAPGLDLVNLRCEYLIQPLGLDVRQPALSWNIRCLETERRGIKQSAYRVLVASDAGILAENRGDLWDSGKVSSDRMIGVRYDGQSLKSSQPCVWKVMVWDEKGQSGDWSKPAAWSMGLLSPSDWKAKWIGAPRRTPPTPANFGYRSLTAKKKTEVKWVQVDLGGAREFSTIKLWPVWPAEFKAPPGDGFPVRFKIEVSDSPDFAKARMIVDRTAADVPNPGREPLLLEFPLARARFVRLTATQLGGEWLAVWDSGNNTWKPKALPRDEWKLALAEMEVLRDGRNIARGTSVSDSDRTKDDHPPGWSRSRLTDGQTEGSAGSDYEKRPAVLARKSFKVKNGLRRATLYATALGCYNLSLNGQQVGDEQLAPGWTIYDKRVLYQTYDLTAQLKAGENMLGTHVGDGWFRMPKEMFDQFDSMKRFAGYGSYPGSEAVWLLGQLELEYEDGSKGLVATDESWLCQPDGPVRTSSMYTGVRYDANYEVPGWDRPGAAAKGWQPAVVRPLADNQIISAQKMEPIRVLEEIKPVRRTDLGDGRTIFDFGREVAGVCRVTTEGRAGDSLKLRYAEALQPDGTLYLGNLAGNYGNNDTFVFSQAGSRSFQAPFTYHGFRYVESSGAKVAAASALVLGSDVKQAFTFESSDARLNTLCALVKNAYRNNMFSLLVDVTGRDERRPWLGDSLTDEIQSLCYLYDFSAFGANEEQVILDAMGPDGSCPGQLRNANGPGASSSAGWADACVVTPYTLWLNYADRRTLETGYAGAKAFMDMAVRNNHDYVPREKYKGTFGDWLNSSKTLKPGAKSWADVGPRGAPADFFGACWWAYSARLVSEMAQALGKPEEAKYYADMAGKVRSAFLKNHVQPDGTVANGTQSAYAMALDFGLLEGETRTQAQARLLKAISAFDNHFSTGSFTTGSLLKALAGQGDQSLAYRLVMQPSLPSYGHMVDHGATAIWERFDAWTPELGFNPNKMNGLSHVGQCSVYEWIVATVAGLRPDFKQPGYQHFFIAPQPISEIPKVRWSYQSVSGPIRCDYSVERGRFRISLSVPPNTRATIVIPVQKDSIVLEGGRPAEKNYGIQLAPNDGGKTMTWDVGSGEYQFEITSR